MGSMSQGEAMEISDYASLLWRRWWVVVLSAVLGVGGGALLVAALPDVYTATATVLVSPLDQESGNSGLNLETETGRVRGAEVVKRARAALKTQESPVDLAERVSVTVPRESTLLEISFSAASPEEAKAGADAFGTAYLADRKRRADANYRKQINSLQNQIASLSAQLKRLDETATDERQIIAGQLEIFGSQLAEAKIKSAGVSVGEMISAAPLPDKPSSPDLLLFLPGGLLAGLMMGVAAAVVVDRVDRKVRRPSDVERVLGLPVLLALPRRRDLAALGLQSARSRVGQHFHELCHALTAKLGSDPGNQVILVTGATPGQGANVVATNVAAVLARTGADAVLLNADLHSSVSNRLLGVRDGQGVAEVLLGSARLKAVETYAATVPALRVISRGNQVNRASDMVQGDRMARIITSLRDQCRYIIIEAPSTASGADAQALAQLADLVLLVVELPGTRYTDIRDAIRRFEQVGRTLPGVAVIPRQRIPSDEPDLAPYPIGRAGVVDGSAAGPAVEMRDDDRDNGKDTTIFPVARSGESHFRKAGG